MTVSYRDIVTILVGYRHPFGNIPSFFLLDTVILFRLKGIPTGLVNRPKTTNRLKVSKE